MVRGDSSTLLVSTTRDHGKMVNSTDREECVTSQIIPFVRDLGKMETTKLE